MDNSIITTRHKKSLEQPGSLPAVDTTKVDNRREELQAKQDNQDSSTTSKPNMPTIKRKVFIETRSKTFAGITVIEWENGVITVRPEQSTPDFIANFTPEQKQELLQLAIKHLSEQKGEKTASKEGLAKALSELDDMQKASKPTVTPPKQPARVFHGILKPKAHKSIPQPVKAVEKVIQKETAQMKPTQQPEKPRQPWFQNNRYFDPNATPAPAAAPQQTTPAAPAPTMAQNLRASRSDLSQLSGHEMAFVKQGGDLSKLPAGTDLTRLDKSGMASLVHSQTLKATEPLFLASGKLYRR